LTKLSGMVCENHDFQTHRAFRTVKEARNVPRKRYWGNLKQLMWKISFRVSLRCSFDSISLDRIVGTLENWSCHWTKLPEWERDEDKGEANFRILGKWKSDYQFCYDKSMNYYRNQYWKWNSLIQNVVLDFCRFCVTHQSNFVYSNQHKGMPACLSDNRRSCNLEHLVQNLRPSSMIKILKKKTDPSSYSNLSSKSAFLTQPLPTEIISNSHDIFCVKIMSKFVSNWRIL